MRRRANLTNDTRRVLEILGAQVRAARVESKLTIAELALRAGVDPRVVSAVERGQGSVTVGNVIEIALMAGVDLFGAGHPDVLESFAEAHRQIAVLMPGRVMRPGFDDDLPF